MSFKKGDLVEITYGNYKGFILEILDIKNEIVWLGNKELGNLVTIQEEYIKYYKVNLVNKLQGYINHLKEMNNITKGYLKFSDLAQEVILNAKGQIEISDMVIKDLENIVNDNTKN